MKLLGLNVPPFAKGGLGGISCPVRKRQVFKSPLPPFCKGGLEQHSHAARGNEQGERFDFIDKAKAIGIVLVVLGHAPGIPDRLVTLIYSFHMPLFFFLSGFLLSRRKLGLGFRAYFGHLLRGLGWPYLGFFAASYAYWLATRHMGARAAKFAGVEWSDPLYGFVTGIGSEIVVNIALWFLPCLMMTAWLYYLSRRVLGTFDALLVFSALGIVAVAAAGFLPDRLPWGLDNAWVALVFYALGQWLREAAPMLPTRLAGPRWAALAVGVYLVGGIAVLSGIAGRVDLNYASFGTAPVLYFPTALCGIAAVLALSHALPNNALCGWLSRNSLLIFPSHPIVINFLSGFGKLVLGLPEAFFTTAVFGLVASLVSLAIPLSFPRSAWECRLDRSAVRVRRGFQSSDKSYCLGTQSVQGCIPTQSVGTIREEGESVGNG